MRSSLLGCVLVVALAGCKAGIGVKSDLQPQSFTPGTTTKMEVVNAIGLPQQVNQDVDGTEHFWYEQSARLSGMCIGCGNPGQVSGLIPAAAVDSSQKHTRANAFEFIFNPAGVLVATRAPPPPAKTR